MNLTELDWMEMMDACTSGHVRRRPTRGLYLLVGSTTRICLFSSRARIAIGSLIDAWRFYAPTGDAARAPPTKPKPRLTRVRACLPFRPTVPSTRISRLDGRIDRFHGQIFSSGYP
jgi:hypothetical protein